MESNQAWDLLVSENQQPTYSDEAWQFAVRSAALSVGGRDFLEQIMDIDKNNLTAMPSLRAFNLLEQRCEGISRELPQMAKNSQTIIDRAETLTQRQHGRLSRIRRTIGTAIVNAGVTLGQVEPRFYK